MQNQTTKWADRHLVFKHVHDSRRTNKYSACDRGGLAEEWCGHSPVIYSL